MWQDIRLNMPTGGIQCWMPDTHCWARCGESPGSVVFDCHKCPSYLPLTFFASEYVWANFNKLHVTIICAVRCKHRILFQQDNDQRHTTKSMEKVHWTSWVVSWRMLISLHSLQISNGKPIAGAVNITLPCLTPILKRRLAFCSS